MLKAVPSTGQWLSWCWEFRTTGAACLGPCQALSLLWRYINSDRSSFFPLTCWACRIPLLYFANQRAEHKETKPLFVEAAEQPEPTNPRGPLSQTCLGCQVPSALEAWRLPLTPSPSSPSGPSGSPAQVPQWLSDCPPGSPWPPHLHFYLLLLWAMRPEKTSSYLTEVSLASSTPSPKEEYICS